jgi:hypothetical protein
MRKGRLRYPMGKHVIFHSDAALDRTIRRPGVPLYHEDASLHR